MSDLKKGRPQATHLELGNNSSSISSSYHDESQLNVRAPTFQKLHRNGLENNDDDEKVCRICLEEDSPETMIAPCRCKGGSKWVHRECLDEWRTNEKDRAFSKCTECLFEYHLQPVYNDNDNESEGGNSKSGCCCCPRTKQQRRRCLFYYMVSKDACLGVVLQQLIVLFLGAVVWLLLLQDENISSSLPPMTPKTKVLVSYGCGWFAFLIVLGIYGCVVMCKNRCDIQKSIPNLGPPSEMDAEEETSATLVRGATDSPIDHNDSYQTYNYSRYKSGGSGEGCYTQEGHHREHHQQRSSCSSSTNYYRRARRRRHYYYGPMYYYDPYYPMYYPMYVDSGNDGSCCCCCCPSGGSEDCTRGIHAATGGGGSSNSSSNGDGNHIMLVILLVVAIILATIGFFVGVIVTIVVIQRIIGRHIYLLQKRQLVKEFRVMDLQDYDLDKPMLENGDDETPNHEHQTNFGNDNLSPNIAGNTRNPPPFSPVVPSEDIAYLKNLGLMEDN